MSSVEPQLEWSSQYTLSTNSSITVSGDKIALPPSALESLLSASSAVVAEKTRRELPAFDPFNSSRYSSYQRVETEFQDQRQQLPYPLTFRIVNPANGRIIYAGIREFSAEDGEAVLSPFLQESLGFTKKGDQQSLERNEDIVSLERLVTIHFKELPKATFVKLRPLEAGYDPEDWKALLEQYLRQNYTTLTNGEVLVVTGSKGIGGTREQYRFLIDGFKPDSDGVCIVDTDLEVDIEALNEEQARETLKRIAEKLNKKSGTETGSSVGGTIDIHRAQEGQVGSGEYVDYELPSWSRTQPLEIELECDDDDAAADLNLFVNPLSATQRAKPRLDEHVFADLSGRSTKRVRLEPSNAFLADAETLQIAVHSFKDKDSMETDVAPRILSRYTLRIHHPRVEATSTSVNRTANDSPMNADEVICKNCGQSVPQRTLILHENFCLRNNVRCSKGCGQVFQKRSPEYENHWHCPFDDEYGNNNSAKKKHDSIFHVSEVIHCPDCSTVETFANLPSLAQHRTTTCPAKLILCRFCHLEVPQEGDPDIPNGEALLSGLTPHELADGSRTTECHLCNKIVKLRDMETHLKNHDLDRRTRLAPHVCRNINCGRTLDVCSKSGDTRAGTRMGQGPGNDIGLCSVCFGPLYVSMYDPENKALRRRIERRYLQQLLTGCSNIWCRNEFCKSGRGHLELSTNNSTKDALPMVKPFISGIGESSHSPLHFCVDEASQKSRNLAQMLAAQVDPANRGGYRFEWCVGALEATKGNLDDAQQWLKNWAPTKNEDGR